MDVQTIVDFAWKNGRALKADANVIGEALRDLAIKIGRADLEDLTKDEVIEEARDPGSPLYCLYDWDKDHGFEYYLREQTKRIFESISYRVVEEGKPETKTIAYVSIQVEEGRRAYVPTTIASMHKEFVMQMEQDALAGLESWKRRYAQITGFSEIVPLIDEVMRRISQKRKRQRGQRRLVQPAPNKRRV